ncbi:MAG: NUDIX hydrolase [Patescibacteria group bacterium]
MNKQRHQNVPASYLVLFQDDQVLLLRRHNTGYEDGNYSLVAGHVESGENFTDCVIREAKEEAGVIVHPDHLQVVHVMHRNSGKDEYSERVDVFFIATTWSGEPINKEPHKCDDVSWFHIKELPDNTIPYIRQALEKIHTKHFYSEHGWI